MEKPARNRKSAPRESLAGAIRTALRAAADPERAPRMQAYMKNTMPYLGLSAPVLRAVVRPLIVARPPRDRRALVRTVRLLWHGATQREERYAAIEICEHHTCDGFQTLALLPLYRELITTGAWWDLVDPIATHRLRRLLERSPRAMARRMRAWSRGRDLWLRRAAILCQVGRKRHTDLPLLYDCIAPNLERPEFWLRKAIGWALRDYAWSDGREVERYVAELGDRLSPLSRREALKNVGR